MTVMPMPHEAGSGAAAEYLGMWMAMMVPMMLPSLIPLLARYRRSVVVGADSRQLQGLTALVGMGYFAIWAVFGAAAWAATRVVMAVQPRSEDLAQWLPVAPGGVVLAAGVVQFSLWKARRLSLCRRGSGCGPAPARTALGAWRHGVALGVSCCFCCGNLMAALLAIGMMEPVAMAAVTLAISAERLAPARWPVAPVAGVAIVVVGVLAIARG